MTYSDKEFKQNNYGRIKKYPYNDGYRYGSKDSDFKTRYSYEDRGGFSDGSVKGGSFGRGGRGGSFNRGDRGGSFGRDERNDRRYKINDYKYGSKDIENSIPQTEVIILKCKLLENIENGEEFVKMYGTNQTFENFSDPCYNQTFKNTFKNFSDACYFISGNKIASLTIANFVNEGAKLLKQIQAFDKRDAKTFKEIATKIGQLIVNGTIKLNTFNSQAIANTFNGLAQCYVDLDRYVDDTFIEALVDKIQNLLNKFNSIDIANTFNGLAKCGVNLGKYFETTKGKESKDAFIKALVGKIQNLLKETNPQKQFTSQHIANTFNGLAQCYVDLDRYVDDTFIEALVDKIQNLLNKFNSIDIANTFNGLGQCGVNLDRYFETEEGKDSKNAFIKALVGKIQNLLKETNPQKQFTSQHIANTFNGLGQCGVNLCGYVNNDFIGALVGRIKDLLNETNFKKQFNSIGIANTFNGLAKCGINLGGYFETEEGEKNAFIGALVNKIQNLLNEKQFTSQELANTFNGLAKCGVNLGGYLNKLENKALKDAFIEALLGKIQTLLNETDSEEQFNSIGIANTFNGLGQCSINLGGYVKDKFIGALVGKIQNLLSTSDFNSIGIANIINGLAQCGVDLGKYFETTEGKKLKDTFIKALVGKIQTLLSTSNFKSQELANTFNGLVKLFLYNEVLYEENISHFKDIINNLVKKYLEPSNKDDQSNWTMLYNIKYLQVYDFEFSKEILSKISDLNLKLDASNDDHTNSALEKNFETFLSEILESKDCYEQESKLTFQVTSNTSFNKPVDFCIEFKHKDKIYKAYIELDGPTHFTDTKQTKKTPQTQIRDILTLKQLQEEQAKVYDNTQILYVTLSANEFDEIKKRITTEKENLIKFLVEQDQLKQITKKTSNNSKMDVEYKSIYDSVNDVASKTMDIEDYTTPTPRQMLSRLGQEARKEHPQERKRTLKDRGLSKDNGQKILKKQTKYTMVDDQLEPGVMQNSDDKSMKQDESIEKNKSAGQHF